MQKQIILLHHTLVILLRVMIPGDRGQLARLDRCAHLTQLNLIKEEKEPTEAVYLALRQPVTV